MKTSDIRRLVRPPELVLVGEKNLSRPAEVLRPYSDSKTVVFSFRPGAPGPGEAVELVSSRAGLPSLWAMIAALQRFGGQIFIFVFSGLTEWVVLRNGRIHAYDWLDSSDRSLVDSIIARSRVGDLVLYCSDESSAPARGPYPGISLQTLAVSSLIREGLRTPGLTELREDSRARSVSGVRRFLGTKAAAAILLCAATAGLIATAATAAAGRAATDSRGQAAAGFAGGIPAPHAARRDTLDGLAPAASEARAARSPAAEFTGLAAVFNLLETRLPPEAGLRSLELGAGAAEALVFIADAGSRSLDLGRLEPRELIRDGDGTRMKLHLSLASPARPARPDAVSLGGSGGFLRRADRVFRTFELSFGDRGGYRLLGSGPARPVIDWLLGSALPPFDGNGRIRLEPAAEGLLSVDISHPASEPANEAGSRSSYERLRDPRSVGGGAGGSGEPSEATDRKVRFSAADVDRWSALFSVKSHSGPGLVGEGAFAAGPAHQAGQVHTAGPAPVAAIVPAAGRGQPAPRLRLIGRMRVGPREVLSFIDDSRGRLFQLSTAEGAQHGGAFYLRTSESSPRAGEVAAGGAVTATATELDERVGDSELYEVVRRADELVVWRGPLRGGQ